MKSDEKLKKKQIIKDDIPVIYKQDIMDNNGKLNTLGALLIIGVTITALNNAFKLLTNNIVDKDNIN